MTIQSLLNGEFYDDLDPNIDTDSNWTSNLNTIKSKDSSTENLSCDL